MSDETVYVCRDFISKDGFLICSDWGVLQLPENNSGVLGLNSLTYSDINQILPLVALLFASAWVWRLLSKQFF